MDNTQTAEWKRGFRVTREALRPASNKQECFYCHRPVGEVHGEDCVLVRRLVRLRATIDYVKPVPAHWGPEQIRFRFQDSTWCAIEDGSQGKGTGRHIAAFILRGKNETK